jgi:FkbM family methyltransferase
MIKRIVFRFLKIHPINYLLRCIGRFLLRSTVIPFRYRLTIEDKICWGIPPVRIDVFTIKVAAKRSIKISGPMDQPEVKNLYWWGALAHEPETIRIFKNLIKDSSLFLDIGANIGYYSLIARALNPLTKIIAFEPVPFVHALCLKNIALNNFHDITVERFAASNGNGRTSLFLPNDTINSASLDSEFRNNTKQIQVTTITLDSYIRSKKLPMPDLIKMDTERTEYLILQGMPQILEQGGPNIICEVLESCDADRLTDILLPFGYKFYFIVHDRLIKMPRIKRDNAIPWEMIQKTPYYNFLFSKSDL